MWVVKVGLADTWQMIKAQIVAPRHSRRGESDLGLKPKAGTKCRFATTRSPP